MLLPTLFDFVMYFDKYTVHCMVGGGLFGRVESDSFARQDSCEKKKMKKMKKEKKMKKKKKKKAATNLLLTWFRLLTRLLFDDVYLFHSFQGPFTVDWT